MNEIEELREEIKKTQIIVLAGGSAKRMGIQNMPKALIKLGNKSLIDRCIELYKRCGFCEFIFLLRQGYEEIKKHVGDGSKYNINVRYSIDPEDGMGKGRAMAFAIKNGSIDKTKRAIISYPDDVFLDKRLPLRLLLHHLNGIEEHNVIATVLFVSGTRYPFGVGKIDNYGIVNEFVEKPLIREYSSTGTVATEPEFYRLIKEKINIKAKSAIEFEDVIYPEIASMGRLYSMVISPDLWIPINTVKDYEAAEKIINQKENN